jgi:hypothetical protein
MPENVQQVEVSRAGFFQARVRLGLHTQAFWGFKNSLNKLGLSCAWAKALQNK